MVERGVLLASSTAECGGDVGFGAAAGGQAQPNVAPLYFLYPRPAPMLIPDASAPDTKFYLGHLTSKVDIE